MIKYVDSGGQVRLVTNIRKPRKWRRFEYLLSSGTQYIDTGYVPNNTSGIYLKAYCTTSGGNHLAIGCRQDAGDTRWWINYSITLELSWNLWTGTLTGYTNTWTEIEHNYKNSRSAKVNGTTYSVSYPTLANITYSAYLFNSCKQGNPGTGFIGRISNAKITEGTTLIRDFVPAQYNGQYGMWDLVEDKFYPNKGTGTFTVGPEIKNYDEIHEVRRASDTYPVPYLYDRTIYEEPDGSKWLRIAHHNNPSTRRFTNSDSFTTYVHTNEHLFFDVSWCNNFTSWELMVKQKTTSSAAELKFRWVLNVNPMIATFSNTKRTNVTYNTSSGYTTPDSDFGGLYKVASDKTYLNGNNNVEGNWWGSIGNYTKYNGGLPGWDSLMVTTGYLDLYIRIA